MKLGVAQNLHASISPKDQSSTIFSRREITSDKALQNHTSGLDPAQRAREFGVDFSCLSPKIWSVDPLF